MPCWLYSPPSLSASSATSSHRYSMFKTSHCTPYCHTQINVNAIHRRVYVCLIRGGGYLRLKWCVRTISGVIRTHYPGFIPFVRY